MGNFPPNNLYRYYAGELEGDGVEDSMLNKYNLS